MDRIFKKTDIEEICTVAKQVITNTKDCIEDIKGIATGISGVAGSIPAEARVGDVGGTAGSLGGKLDKDSYDLAKMKLESCKEKACAVIPSYDAQYAEQMREITRMTGNIKIVLEELEEFMLETPLDTPVNVFSRLIEAKQVQWIKMLDGVEATLDEVLANVKGAERISTIFSKDPVNLSTGNFIYDKEDLRCEGNSPFVFRRFYNSRNTYEGALGTDWNHNYEIHLTLKESDITILLTDGKEEHFLPVDKTHYTPSDQSLATLEKTETGYTYTTLAGEKTIFDQKGNYIRQEDANGCGYSLTYENVENMGEKLVRITKDSGEYFALTYDENGYLKTVTDHTGRNFHYEIKNGHLLSAVRPDGAGFTYEYDGNGKLISVTNPRGICTVENEYDENHRTTLQKFPDGTQMTYEYDDEKHTVTMTERNGAKTIHIHDEKYRNIKNIYPDGEETFTYNSRNQKTKITDKLGNITRLSYDNRGNLTGITNPLGTKLTITYEAHNKPTNIKINGKEKQKNTFDKKGNLIETMDALGRKTTLSYNEKGQPIAIKKADNSLILITYDETGNILKLTDETGSTTTYTYDALNRVESTTDPKGNTITFTYDIAGNIKTVKNAAGDVRTYEYNQSNKVTKITDFDGSTIQRSYNVLNKPQVITDQLGRQTTLTYDAMWNLARITTPDGAKTTYIYNQNNHLTRIKDAAGNVTRYTYDGNGNCTIKEDQTGETTRFTYDAIGRLIHVESPDGKHMTYTYDAEGHLIMAEDALENTVTMQYDEAGQLICETNPMGESRSYTYTALGKVATVTDEAGRITTYDYLPGGKVSQITYNDGTKETYTYDANGNVETHTNRTGFTIRYEYDNLDRITTINGANGEIKTYTYDPVGNVTAVTDAYGNTTHYEYSLTGKLTKVTDPLGNATIYTYDLCDRLVGICQYADENQADQICHTTTYQRNILGQIETITDPLGISEHYKYDPKGQLMEKLDKEGYLTQYTYTNEGDISHIRYADGREVRLSYNPLRQLEEVKDWLGTTKIQNDAMGRALKIQYPDGKEISYTYGTSGERTSITYPDGKTIYYHYDEQLRLTATEDGEDIISYTYDKTGRITEKVFPNGSHTTYAYNAKGQLAELSHADKEGVLDRYIYAYDLLGNKTTIEKQRRGLVEESGTYTYGYDALSRLAEVKKDGRQLRAYEYDAFGNRTNLVEEGIQTTYTYNAANQLLSKISGTDEETFTYDKRGNLRLVMENGILKNRYTYGANNRLEQAVNGNGQMSTYQYNGLGHRVGKTIGTEPLQNVEIPDPEKQIRYTIDLTRGYHNLLQTEENGETTQTYLWDGNVAAVINHTDPGSHIQDNPVHAPARNYYLQDELGSPIRLMDETGNLTETYGYDEFGQDLYGNQGIIQPFGYTGYQADPVAGTYFAQAREYRPEEGRFGAKDEDVFIDIYTTKSLNQYQYCGANSINYIDYMGHEEECPDYEMSNSIGDGTYISEPDPNIQYQEIEEKKGTLTLKLAFGFNVFGGFSGDLDISVDRHGNIALQTSKAEFIDERYNTRNIGILDFGIAGQLQYTNAETVYDLNGNAEYIGVTAGAGPYVGIDAISLPDSNGKYNDIDGVQLQVGGGVGVDVHITRGYTETIGSFNIIDVIGGIKRSLGFN